MSQGVKFSSAYWTVNVAEMLERTAYYGIFIAITFYLSNILGFYAGYNIIKSYLRFFSRIGAVFNIYHLYMMFFSFKLKSVKSHNKLI